MLSQIQYISWQRSKYINDLQYLPKLCKQNCKALTRSQFLKEIELGDNFYRISATADITVQCFLSVCPEMCYRKRSQIMSSHVVQLCM